MADDPGYDVGYREGESNRQADWDYALTDLVELPDDVDITPVGVAGYIARLQAELADARSKPPVRIIEVEEPRA